MNFKLWLESEDLKKYLNDINTLPEIDKEKMEYKTPNMAIYSSKNGSYRYIYFINDKPVSVLQLVKTGPREATVANAYTLPEYRRMGLATKLLEKARKKFKIDHSKYLSKDGEGWVKANF